jgi:putative SOS response-associated peptidase YedK
MIPVIVRQNDQNVLREFRWGLVPFWADDQTIGNRMINAWSETADAKPSFRGAFKKR